MQEIKNKLNSIEDRLYDLNATLARNTEILDAHHRRTTLNEQRIEFIEKHVMFVNNALKLMGFFVTVLVVLQELNLFSLASFLGIK